jgi:hypothetical protein
MKRTIDRGNNQIGSSFILTSVGRKQSQSQVRKRRFPIRKWLTRRCSLFSQPPRGEVATMKVRGVMMDDIAPRPDPVRRDLAGEVNPKTDESSAGSSSSGRRFFAFIASTPIPPLSGRAVARSLLTCPWRPIDFC